MGRHSAERVKRSRSTASKSWPKFRGLAKSGISGADSADGTLFGDPSLNLFGCSLVGGAR
jgi:hypothetical protein